MNMEYNVKRKEVHMHYFANARAIAAMWAIFTICFLIFGIVILVQPEWIGDTEDTPRPGHFGLYEYCVTDQDDVRIICYGRISEFKTILHPAFGTATVFCVLSIVLTIICLLCMFLFCCVRDRIVFIICGILQILIAICLFLTIVIYPAGWNHASVRQVCGSQADRYYPGDCGIRWAMILAIVALFDIVILAILAIVLAFKFGQMSLPAKQFKVKRLKEAPSQQSIPRSVRSVHSSNRDLAHAGTLPATGQRGAPVARYDATM